MISPKIIKKIKTTRNITTAIGISALLLALSGLHIFIHYHFILTLFSFGIGASVGLCIRDIERDIAKKMGLDCPACNWPIYYEGVKNRLDREARDYKYLIKTGNCANCGKPVSNDNHLRT